MKEEKEIWKFEAALKKNKMTQKPQKDRIERR